MIAMPGVKPAPTFTHDAASLAAATLIAASMVASRCVAEMPSLAATVVLVLGFGLAATGLARMTLRLVPKP